MKHILNGFIALAMVLMFTQCTDNKANDKNVNCHSSPLYHFLFFILPSVSIIT